MTRHSAARMYSRRSEDRRELSVVRVYGPGRRASWITLLRSSEGLAFNDRDDWLMHGLLPHLEEARRQNWLLAFQRAELGPDAAHAVLDCRGTVYFQTKCFPALVRCELQYDGIRLDADVVSALRSVGTWIGSNLAICARRNHEMLMVSARPLQLADALSPREREVAILVARGETHKTIARGLGISPTTVRTLMQRIHGKLGTHHVTAWQPLLRSIGPDSPCR